MVLTVLQEREQICNRSQKTTLIVVDANVTDLPSLVADLPADADIVLLEAEANGIEQITQALNQRKSVSSLHLVSHGTPGSLHLGNSQLNLSTLNKNAALLGQWATLLTGKDILLYGCQVAEGALGYLFLQQLAQLTGANIAASTRRVGKVNGQPNWTLDTQIGNVQTDVVFSEALQQRYEGSFVEVSFNIEQDVAIETEGTRVTFNFTLDEAPPPEGTVVVLSANEPASINRFVLGGFGEELEFTGIDGVNENPLFFDVSPNLDFSELAVNIREQTASITAELFNSPNDESLDGPGSPDIEDAGDVAEDITWSIRTIAPGDVPNGLGGTPGTVAAGASSDTITFADNPGQLTPPAVPEISITSDITTLVEDEGTEVTLTFSLSEPPPADGIIISVATGKEFALGDFDIFPPPPLASATGGALVSGFADNSGFTFRITDQTATISLPIFDDPDRTENGAVTDPDGPLRNDDIGEEQTTFTVEPGDGYTVAAGSSSVTLTLLDTNAPANTAPVAADDSFTVDEDTVLTGDVSGNDTDTEGDASYALDADATNGTVALADDGSFTYTPDADFNGTDSFTYTLSDAEFSSTATVNITVDDVVDNTAPVAADDSFTVAEDTVLTGDVSGNDTDTEGDASYALDADAANGTVALADDGSFTYTPNADFNGTDSFTYTLSDAEFSSTATVNITVDDVVDNTAPVAADDSFTVNENTVLNGDVSGNDTDTEGDASYALDADAANGTVALAADGSFTYTPNADFNGADSFTYTLSDADFSSTATVNITVDDVVVADPVVSFSTTEGTLSEAAGDELVLSFAVDGTIPPVVLDDEGNYVSGGIAVNLEGDTAEILQQLLAPDGDGAVQTRVSDDGINVFYRFDTSFGPGAGLTGGILEVFSLEDGDPAEGSSDPAAAGTGFLSNFSFIITDTNASITLPVSDDIVQEEDQAFSYTLVDGAGYTVDPTQNSGTFTVTDGVTPATSPVVGVTASETTLIEDEQTRTTITFTTEGDIPTGGFLVQLKGPVRSIAEFDVNGTNNTQPRDPEGELVITGPVVTGGNIAGTDEVAGSVFFRITEATASIDVAVFDDDIEEGTENFTFELVDGEDYEVDGANSGIDLTIEDESVVVDDPVVSFTTSTDSLNEAEGTPISFNFSVDGEIPADGLIVRTADNFFPNPQLDFNLLDFSDPNVIDGIEFFDFEETGPGQFVIDWKITKPEAFIKVAVFDDNIAEADTSFTTGLLPGDGYTLNPDATTATVSVTDGVDGIGGPSVSLTADKTAVNEGESLTLTFNVAGDIPDGGLEVSVDSDTAGALGDFITTDETGNPLLTFTGLSAAPAPNGDASGFIVNITESTATISLDVFDDGPGEGSETFDFQILDGENYDVDPQAGGFTVTLNDEPVSGSPVVSFSTTSGTLSEAAGDELVLSFEVDGAIPPVVLDDEGNYVSGGIAVNLEGDTAEILQQFLAPDGDGAVQTRVSDDGVNVFYRFDTSFGPDAGLTGGILEVFSLEDGDPAEGSSDPDAAGTGFLSNFSFILTDANASITLPVSDDIVQEEDKTFSYTLVDGAGYTVDPTQNSGTFTVTDGVTPATSPTVGVTASETTLIEDEQTRTTITFTTEGAIPDGGFLVQLKGPVRAIAEFDVNGTNNTQPRDPEGELVVTGPVVTGGNIAGTDEVAGSVFFRITEATASIDVAVFDDDVPEGTENFTFSLVDGEDYEVDAANSGINLTIEDGIVAPVVPEVSLSIEPDVLSEEDADTTLVSVGFSVDGVIPEGGLSVLVTGSVDILDQVDGARDIAFNNAVLGDFFDPATGTFEVIISANSGSIDLPILNDVIQEEDQDFTFTLVENDAGAIDATYTINPAASTDTVTLIDGIGGPGVGPTVGISVSDTSLHEGDTFTVNFTVDGDIPEGGLTVLVDSPTPRSIGEFVIFNEDGSPAVEFEGIAGFPEIGDSGASSFLVTITEPTASLTLSVFDDGANEGPETLSFGLVDGEIYEVDPAASSFTFTLNDFETVGTDESDRLVGDDMDNSLAGLGGSDIIAGGLANDIILGGDGHDVLRGDLNSRRTQDDVAGGNDIIFGGDGDDRIGGKAGNDILSGDAGDDMIWGDDGNDTIMGGTGDDILVGDNGSKGTGSDLFVFGNGDGTDTIVDFEVGTDRIGLVEGELTFADLTVTQDGHNALLGVTSTGETLAVLNGVNASDLTQSSFESVADVSNLDDALALI